VLSGVIFDSFTRQNKAIECHSHYRHQGGVLAACRRSVNARNTYDGTNLYRQATRALIYAPKVPLCRSLYRDYTCYYQQYIASVLDRQSEFSPVRTKVFSSLASQHCAGLSVSGHTQRFLFCIHAFTSESLES
jgi:hypothetical protein